MFLERRRGLGLGDPRFDRRLGEDRVAPLGEGSSRFRWIVDPDHSERFAIGFPPSMEESGLGGQGSWDRGGDRA